MENPLCVESFSLSNCSRRSYHFLKKKGFPKDWMVNSITNCFFLITKGRHVKTWKINFFSFHFLITTEERIAFVE
ncbi:hypothetical protein A7Q09_05805 [Methylacidiphilum sp. Yel]|nr:hypothetical protein A7Q09_05805 [Methylacidiphilum sp. Yel]